MNEPLVFITELGGRMLWAGDELQRQTGYTLADFQYDNPDNPFIHPDDMPAVTAHFIAFAEGESLVSSEVENRFFTKWGEAVRYRSTLTKVQYGGVSAFQVECYRMGTAAEQALVQSEARFRRLVETATDAIIRVDGDGRFLYTNRRFQDWVGLDPVALRDTRLVDHVAPEHRQGVRDAVSEASRRGHSVKFEARLLDSDGAARWIGARVVGLEDPDDPGAVQGILRDTTEAREIDGRLRRAQKMESLGLFAGGVAHDFNNLLTGILGNVSLAEHHGASDDALTAQLAAIRLAAERAAELTQSILAYAGGASAALQPLDANRLVREVLPLVRAAVTSRVSIDIQPADLPLVVRGDTGQLTQVLLNLVTNAAEALPEGGRVVVRSASHGDAESLGVWATDPLDATSFAVIQVQDGGPGIDVAVLEKMFDPFFTTKGSGRGLGLSAVLGIIRSHGGGLMIRTGPTGGTTFSVLLPFATDPVATPVPAPSAQAPIPAGHVLLVDDEPVLREVSQSLLEHLGFTVRAVESGRDALRELAQSPDLFSLVLLDETMPGLSGAETLEALRTTHPDLPVLRTSGFTLEGLDLEGPTGFLAKPYTFKVLEDAVRAVLGKRSR